MTLPSQIAFPDHDVEEVTETTQDEKLEPPCRVIIHNDDVTPFEFVIIILQRIFELNAMVAEKVAYTAHTNGTAYVTTLPCAEAHRRVGKAHFAASLEGFPLTFSVEPEE